MPEVASASPTPASFSEEEKNVKLLLSEPQLEARLRRAKAMRYLHTLGRKHKKFKGFTSVRTFQGLRP